jgi:hypothetical protein
MMNIIQKVCMMRFMRMVGLPSRPARAILPTGQPVVGSAGSASGWWSGATTIAGPRSQPRHGGDWRAFGTVDERAELNADNNKEIRSWTVWGSPACQERSA